MDPVEAETALGAGLQAIGVEVPPGAVTFQAERADRAFAGRGVITALIVQPHRATALRRRAQHGQQGGQWWRCTGCRVMAGRWWRNGGCRTQGKQGRVGCRGERRGEASAQPGQQLVARAGRGALGRAGTIVGAGEQQGRLLSRGKASRRGDGRRGWRGHGAASAGQGAHQCRLTPGRHQSHAGRQMGLDGAPGGALAQRPDQVLGLVTDQHGTGKQSHPARRRERVWQDGAPSRQQRAQAGRIVAP